VGALRSAIDELSGADLRRSSDDELEAELEEIERILREGNGAGRQRAAFRRGGISSVLELLAGETASSYR
jgi:hypothetical protein